MEFIHPDILYALVLVPLLALMLVYVRYRQRKKLSRLFKNNQWKYLTPERSRAKFITKTIFRLLSLAAVIIAAAGPVAGVRYRSSQRLGADLVFIMDVSTSMSARDELPSRLDKAKITMDEILNQLKADRVGIVIMGGEGYVQLPVTSDYGAAHMVLESMEAGGVPTQGSNLASSIEKAMLAYPPESETGKAIIILSDGENHEPGAMEAVKKAAGAGITIFTVGFGTEKGATLETVKFDGTVEEKTDMYGQTVITKLDEKTLKAIAEAGGGQYVKGSDPGSAAKTILSSIDRMEKFRIGEKKYSESDHRFQYALGISILLLLIEVLTTERPTWLWKKLGFLQANSGKK